ncbi:MAG: MMPL family transporter [Clostridiales bacterium]|nr:MMPL family transporter [Clostridiales bacterium]
MKKFYQFVVRHRNVILALFFLMAAAGGVLSQLVDVNYDMKDYLPESSPSTVSLEVMQSEFDGGIPNARVMVKDVSIAQALEYKEMLLACEGVTDVTWLDDAIDILEPLELADADTVETYYKDGAALFSVTIDDDCRVEAVDAIRSVIGDDNAMDGDAVSTALATTGTVTEIPKIVVFAVLFVLLVLLLTTTSFVEPFIILIGLGVAILINSGTNLFFGEISFVTNAAGAILQLAVSLDYSVFLLHRFDECLQENDSRQDAMVEALCKSTSSISSSGLTTVIGFLALVFMQFQIGPDLGLVLAKGVAISLITVFLFMPALILSTHKWIERTSHRNFMPSFYGFGRFICKVMLPMVCVFVILVVPSYLASNKNDFYYGSAYVYGTDTQYGQDVKAIESIFGKSDTYVVLVPAGDTAAEQELSDALHELSQVKSIISYVDTVGAEIPMEYLDESIVEQLVSDHYSRFVVTVEIDSEGAETFALVESIREILDTLYPEENYLAGTGVSSYDLMDTITADTVKVNSIAIAAVFMVLLLSMKSITLPIILVLSIETAIWINLALPYFVGYTVHYIAYLIISSIQLGATVDYAILFTDRYMEHRQAMDKKSAIQETIPNVMVSVLTSGSVLAVVGFLLGGVSTNGILRQLGKFLGAGSLLSMSIVLFVLPGLLYLLDGMIRRTTLHTDHHKSLPEVIR